MLDALLADNTHSWTCAPTRPGAGAASQEGRANGARPRHRSCAAHRTCTVFARLGAAERGGADPASLLRDEGT